MSLEDIRSMVEKDKKMGCNFLRLAHYPRAEDAARMADEMGMLLWEEIPVYWWIDFENPAFQVMKAYYEERKQKEKQSEGE